MTRFLVILRGGLLASVLVAGASGCQLIADFDRSKIPSDAGPLPDAGPQPDASLDAQLLDGAFDDAGSDDAGKDAAQDAAQDADTVDDAGTEGDAGSDDAG